MVLRSVQILQLSYLSRLHLKWHFTVFLVATLDTKHLAKHFSMLKMDFLKKFCTTGVLWILLIHNLFSLLCPWAMVVTCNTDCEAERRIVRWNSGGFVRQEDRQNGQTDGFLCTNLFLLFACEHLGGNCQHILMRNSHWVLLSVAWILQRLLIPCYTLLSIGLLMQCILGWSHRFVPRDAFELVTSRRKWIIILTNVTANRNPQ